MTLLTEQVLKNNILKQLLINNSFITVTLSDTWVVLYCVHEGLISSRYFEKKKQKKYYFKVTNYQFHIFVIMKSILKQHLY